MSQQEIFDFIKNHLSIDIEDDTYYSRGGPQDSDMYGFKIKLLLKNPTTGDLEIIDEKKYSLGW